MSIIVSNIFHFFGTFIHGMKDAKFRSLLFFVIIILLIGTAFYHRIEHWSWLDSFYFSSISLTTVGYGDMVPKTDIGKLFTVFYIFSGVGVILSFVTSVANKAHERRAIESELALAKKYHR